MFFKIIDNLINHTVMDIIYGSLSFPTKVNVEEGICLVDANRSVSATLEHMWSVKYKKSENMRLLAVLCFVIVVQSQDSTDGIYDKQKDDQWFKDGVNLIKENLKHKNINKKAKNAILFIGDGMGVSTVTAARILDGQLQNKTGEENVLSWEEFPNVALSKTYNTDVQTADSAGSATAILTGVKAREGVVSVNEKVARYDCEASKNNKVLSLIMLAEMAGLSTGVVTTSELTHATPSTAYSHSADRGWECDADMKPNSTCKDIASQLINSPYGDGLEIAFGGGRKYFFPTSIEDPEEKGKFGKRKDGRNLVDEWVNKKTKDKVFSYVWNETNFKKLDPTKVDHVLGLFDYSHMQFSHNRKKDTAGEPSLTEMVEFAIKTLERNPKGYVLLVEGARIDHAHHKSKAFHALHDTVELANAVRKSKELTKKEDTLLLVTADHSHVFTFGGYQKRGSPIFGLTNADQFIANDGMRYPTLGYVNGPGAKINASRNPVTEKELRDPEFVWPSLVNVNSESHGGEDVAVYALGPQAHLLRGVVEQNYIFHVLDYALCLSESKKSLCRSEGLMDRRNFSESVHNIQHYFLYISIFLTLCNKILPR